MIPPPNIREAKKLLAEHRKATRKQRPKSPKADRGRVRDNGYLAWLRRQPCAISRLSGFGMLFCERPVQAAHIRTHKPGEMPTGLQRKPDDNRATPLCAGHHAEQHAMNEMAFWRKHGLDPFKVAEEHYARYRAEGLTP